MPDITGITNTLGTNHGNRTTKLSAHNLRYQRAQAEAQHRDPEDTHHAEPIIGGRLHGHSMLQTAEQRAADLLATFGPQPSWMQNTPCRQADPDIFFPPVGSNAHEAKRICGTCHASDDCLQWALDNREDHGIWGGTSARDRQQLRRHPNEDAA